MDENDIRYQPEEVKSGLIVGHGEAHSTKAFLVGLLSSYRHAFAFIDKNLMLKSRIAFELGLKLQEMNVPMRAVDASESLKTMDTVMDICKWLMEKGADRNAVLVAVGGGITIDMVGFAASIYKRGVRYVSVPTTLLSQVDAGLGGKTGVNFLHYKNMLGTVHQPTFTFIWPEFLKTLPRRDFLSGAAELLKTFIISNEDGQWYGRATAVLQRYAEVGGDWKQVDMNEMTAVIEAAAKVKSAVVSRDPFEKNERRKLNLGHTFAHAIESLAQKNDMDITHGEAVAMGIVLAARIADRLGTGVRAGSGFAEQIEKDFRSCGLTVDCPFAVKDMAEAMRQDKKAEGSKVHFVLSREIGSVEIVDLSVEDVCRMFA